jgi:NADPH-dependent ferric siderophore reductase
MAVRELRVAHVAALTPRMVRVTLVGDLAGFASLGPTGHAKVYFPDPVTGVLAGPTVRPDGTLEQPAPDLVHVRDYTARTFRPSGADGPELDLDLVVHGDDGPASVWAGRAARGDRLVIAGPKSSKLVPDDVCDVVLGADETALPAVARWLELLPKDVAVRVMAEVESPDDEPYLADVAVRGRLEVSWLHRSEARGATDLLERAVRSLGPIGPSTFLWFGGEAGSLVGVRRYLRRELGLPAGQVELTGYWRRGQAGFDHHAPLDPRDPD